MARWIEVARVEDCPPGTGRTVAVDDRKLAVFNEDGRFFAIDDTCPHQGASLGEGALHEGRVICPLHSWVFELASGQCPRGTHPGVATYPTRCHDGGVEVHVPAGAQE